MATPLALDSKLGPNRLMEWTGLLRLAAAILCSLAIVWSFIVPLDSTSVQLGETLPQNLLWFLIGVVTAGANWLETKQGFRKAGYGPPVMKRTWLVLATVVCIMYCGAWSAGAENNPRIAWYGFWHLVSLGVFFFSTRHLLGSREAKNTAILILLAGFVAVALHGLYQVSVTLPRDRAAYLQDPDKMLESIGISAPEGSPLRKRFEDRLLYSPEPFGTFALANSLATSLSAGVILFLGLLSSFVGLSSNQTTSISDARSNRTLMTYYLPAAYCGCLLLAVLVCWFLARSRIAYVAVMVAIGYWLALSRTKSASQSVHRQWLRVSALVGITLGALGFAWILKNDQLVLSESFKSFSYRIEYWRAAAAMLRDHWLLGVGYGNFQSYYPAYKPELASEIVADPHNWFLDIAAGVSLPIALIIALWIFKFLLPHLNGNQSSAPDDKSLDQELTATIVSGLKWGSVLGATLIVLLGSILSALEFQTLAFCWLVGGITAIVLDKSIVSRECIQAACLSIVLCQLISGSWQAAGIALPLLVLLSSLSPNRNDQIAPVSPWLPLVVVILLGVGFWFQTWRPSLASWILANQASFATEPREHLALLRKSSEADPLNSERRRQVAEWLVVATAGAMNDSSLSLAASEAHQSIVDWLQSDQVPYHNWQIAGDWYLQLAARSRVAFQDTQVKDFLRKAYECYQASVERYPSSVNLNLQLALVAELIGDREEAQAALLRSIDLNNRTPHLDKKFGFQQIWLPSGIEPSGFSRPNSTAEENLIPAEPLVNWLRKDLDIPKED